MDDNEIKDLLGKLTKKVDKLLNINTKIAKALHLIPVSEKEERDIQLTQRTNLQTAAKVNDDLNAMENKTESEHVSIFEEVAVGSVFGDVLADDFLE